MSEKPSRPAVQRGVSTVSQAPRPALERGQSGISDSSRSPVQRGVSTISSRSSAKELADAIAEARSVQWQQSVQQQPPLDPSLKRRFLSIMGHTVLILMLAVYSAAGGVAFIYLESPNEIAFQNRTREDVQAQRFEFFNNMWNYILDDINCRCLSAEDISTQNDAYIYLQNKTEMFFNNELLNYSKLIYLAASSKVDVHEEEPDYQWSYPRSMFFSATVITTIGYGNIAPTTTWGRIFCIIYALFGIPLTLIAIADMGKLFADLIKYMYKKAKKKGLDKMKKKFDRAADEATVATTPSALKAMTSFKVLGAMTLLLMYIALGGALFLLWEEWTFLESFYFCFITMTTIGLGDVVPEHQMFMLGCTVYILIGLALTSTCIELARSEYEKSWKRMLEASKRLQGISLVDTLRRIGDQMEMHGDFTNQNFLQELKYVISGKRSDQNGKPPPIIYYETSV